MALAEEMRRLEQRLEGHEGPVLSVYLSVNPRYNENQGQAYKVRLKDALRETEGLPEELSERVRQEVEGGTPPPPRARSSFSPRGTGFSSATNCR